MFLREQESVEKLLKEAFKKTGLAEYLQSITGVRELTGVLFLTEIGDPRNYHN